MEVFFLVDEFSIVSFSGIVEAAKPDEVYYVYKNDGVEFTKEVDLRIEEVKTSGAWVGRLAYPVSFNVCSVRWGKEV